jgi:polygalacturonase
MQRCFGCAVATYVAVTTTVVESALSIDQYGAIRNDQSYNAAFMNGKALWQAVNAANHGSPNNDTRTVLVPPFNYTVVPYAPLTNVNDVAVQLEGVLWAWNNQSTWPNDTGGNALDFISFDTCSGIRLFGAGRIEGQGYSWWMTVYETGVDNRPHLLVMQRCQGVEITGWTLRNSPQYHAKLYDMKDLLVRAFVLPSCMTEF